MDKICDNCIYCYKPSTVKDFFDKTLTPPNLCKWGKDIFKHEFWLCGSPEVSKIDHTNNSLVYKVCETVNKRGNCEHFRTGNAEDIIPSSVEVTTTEPIPEKIKTDTELILETVITPATIPAVTEEVTVEKEVPVTDSNGNPLYDDNNQPITEIKEVTETIIVVPEHENDQDISYKYQWYKNGRKLFNETKSTLNVDTTEEEVAVYSCELIQDIKQNGDGGVKHASVMSNEVTVNIVKPIENIITLNVTTGSVNIVLPLPFKISNYNYPFTSSWAENWTIKTAAENREDLEITTELLPEIKAESLGDIEVNISDSAITLKPLKENTNGTIGFSWETIE